LARNPCTKLSVDEIEEKRNDILYEHAMSVKNTGDILKITDALMKIANTEYERAKLVYMWLGENLKYDLAACRTGKIPSQSAEAVLKSGKSVCAGFSTLAKQIGQRAGLKILEIEGYAKKKSGATGYSWAKPNHAWNVVRLENGRDIVFDATWGAGQSSTPVSKPNSNQKCKPKSGSTKTSTTKTSTSSKSVSKTKTPSDIWTKEYRDYWFDTDPYFFALRHLPKEGLEKWSLVEKITLSQFGNLPNPIEHLMFEGIVESKTIYQDFLQGITYGLPNILESGYTIKFIKIPVGTVKGKNYHFEFECEKTDTIGIVHDGKILTTFDKNADKKFKFDLCFENSGYYGVCVKEVVDETTTTMKFVLKYNVK